MIRTGLLLPLLVLVLGSGCRSTGEYFRCRGRDLADVVTLELTAGPGVDVHGQATTFVGAAAGWSVQKGLFWHGRHVGGGRRETAGFVLLGATEARPLTPPGPEPAPRMPVRRAAWAMFLPLLVSPADGVHLGYVADWPHTADVTMGASAGIGFHLGVSPGEALDFLAGLTTLDPAGDDSPPPPPKEPEEIPPPTLPPPQRGPWRPWYFPPQIRNP